MSLSITDRGGLLSQDLRLLAERRLLFALSRFDDRIGQVELVVTDENGPRGGIDKACRVTISLHRAPDVIVRDKDSEMAKCISRAAERAGRAVSRAIDKTQSFSRERVSFDDASMDANPLGETAP